MSGSSSVSEGAANRGTLEDSRGRRRGDQFVGTSRAVKRAMEQTAVAGRGRFAVFISGEEGVDKDLLADEAVYAQVLCGQRYDCGSKLGYLQATVQYALRHPELRTEFAHYLRALNPDTIEEGEA